MEHLTYIPDRLKELSRIISDLEWDGEMCELQKQEKARIESLLNRGVLYSPNF